MHIFLRLELFQKFPVTAQLRIYPCHQFHRSKWFCNIVVCPDIEPHDLIHFLRFCRQHDHRKIILFPQPHRHTDSVHPRHHNVYDRQMNLFFFQNLKPFHAVLCLEHLISLALQIDLHSFPDLLIILYYQNMINLHLTHPPCWHSYLQNQTYIRKN